MSLYKAYSNAAKTVSGTRQVVMLYDGTIKSIQQAKLAIEEHRVEDRYLALSKASEIIHGLQSCLDFDQGGQVAEVLHRFYASMDLRIFGLHSKPAGPMCDQIIAELKEMRDTWDSIDRGTYEGENGSNGDANASAAEPLSDAAMAVNQGNVEPLRIVL